jgi:hypothetical protein
MSWLTAFGTLHHQLASVHPRASLEAFVDRQTMISIARELNESAREELNPFTVDEVMLYGMKISVSEERTSRIVAGND